MTNQLARENAVAERAAQSMTDLFTMPLTGATT